MLLTTTIKCCSCNCSRTFRFRRRTSRSATRQLASFRHWRGEETPLWTIHVSWAGKWYEKNYIPVFLLFIFLGGTARQDRYERMLSQGHVSALTPKKIFKESRSTELKKQVFDLVKNGRKMTQCEARKTFSQYLQCVLRRISTMPEQEGHVEIVLKFLQKASNYLRTPFPVKVGEVWLWWMLFQICCNCT